MRRSIGSLLGARDLFTTLVIRQFRIRRKQSRLGLVWPVLAPLLLTLLYTVVFKRVVSVPIDRYPSFLLCGLLPWSFLSTAISRSIPSISTEPDLVRKAPFPYALLPITSVAANVVTFAATLVLFVAYLIVRGEAHLAMLPLLVVPVLSLLLLTGGIVVVLSLIDVFNHDLRHIIGNILPIWFFLLPVVYRPTMAPGYVQVLQSIDPMAAVVGQFRSVLYTGNSGDVVGLVAALVACAALFFGSILLFDRASRDLAKIV